jgi:hypothetical protein
MIKNDLLKNEHGDLSMRITSMMNMPEESVKEIQDDKKSINKRNHSKSNFSYSGSRSTRPNTTNAYNIITSSYRSSVMK